MDVVIKYFVLFYIIIILLITLVLASVISTKSIFDAIALPTVSTQV